MPEKSGKLKFCCSIHLEILSSALLFDISEEVNKANLFFFLCPYHILGYLKEFHEAAKFELFPKIQLFSVQLF